MTLSNKNPFTNFIFRRLFMSFYQINIFYNYIYNIIYKSRNLFDFFLSKNYNVYELKFSGESYEKERKKQREIAC